MPNSKNPDKYTNLIEGYADWLESHNFIHKILQLWRKHFAFIIILTTLMFFLISFCFALFSSPITSSSINENIENASVIELRQKIIQLEAEIADLRKELKTLQNKISRDLQKDTEKLPDEN